MNSFITIEVYDKVPLAQVAVLALEEEGIQCLLQNETIISLDWFMSNAVGGVQLQVPEKDANAAKRILDEIRDSKKLREEFTKDIWVAFYCERCKKPIAFSGLSLGRVESCPKCGKHIDVPQSSDLSMEEDLIPATIHEAQNYSTFLNQDQSQKTYLIGELCLVLCIAYFPEVLNATTTYLEQSRNLAVNEYSAEYLANWLSMRSLYVLLCMIPILLLHPLAREFNLAGESNLLRESSAANSWTWLTSLGCGLLLACVCVVPTYAIAFFANEPTYERIIEWPVWLGSLSSLYWYSWFAFAIIANSIAEELVMRAFLIDRLQKLFGKTWIAILVPAMLFGSYHIYQGVTGLVCATLMGVVFGMHYARYRRLLPLVIAHTLCNFLSYAIYFLYHPYE